MSDTTNGQIDKQKQAALDALQSKEISEVDPDAIHIYFKYEKKFLDIYSETFDFKLACREAGMKPEEIRKNNYLMKEIKSLQQLAQSSHRIKVMSGKHIKLMEKFEKHYDKLVKDEEHKAAVTMAGNLARMTDSGMRASGEFKDDDRDTGINVSININMDHQYDDKDKEAPITIKAEEVKK